MSYRAMQKDAENVDKLAYQGLQSHSLLTHTHNKGDLIRIKQQLPQSGDGSCEDKE